MTTFCPFAREAGRSIHWVDQARHRREAEHPDCQVEAQWKASHCRWERQKPRSEYCCLAAGPRQQPLGWRWVAERRSPANLGSVVLLQGERVRGHRGMDWLKDRLASRRRSEQRGVRPAVLRARPTRRHSLCAPACSQRGLERASRHLESTRYCHRWPELHRTIAGEALPPMPECADCSQGRSSHRLAGLAGPEPETRPSGVQKAEEGAGARGLPSTVSLSMNYRQGGQGFASAKLADDKCPERGDTLRAVQHREQV